MVATKVDLLKGDYSSLDQAAKVAHQKGWLFFKTSAKENIGVNEVFEALICRYFKIDSAVFALGSSSPEAKTLQVSSPESSDAPSGQVRLGNTFGLKDKLQKVQDLPDEVQTDLPKRLEGTNEGGFISRLMKLCCG